MFFYANDSDLSDSLKEEVIKIPELFPTLVIIYLIKRNISVN